jgi:hypothetical protein
MSLRGFQLVVTLAGALKQACSTINFDIQRPEPTTKPEVVSNLAKLLSHKVQFERLKDGTAFKPTPASTHCGGYVFDN